LSDIIFPIVRKKFPSSMKGKIMSEYPDPESILYKSVKKRMTINGGMAHSYIKGFIFIPYSLVIEEYQEPVDMTKLHIVYVERIEILEEGLEEEEFNLVKDNWEKRIKEYKE